MDDPQTPEEKEAYLKRNASLVWNVGTILEDRRDHVDADVVRIWDHLYANLDSIYDQIGPTIDRTEDLIFGDFPKEEEEEEGIPYSKLGAFKTVVIEYSGSGDEGYINDIQPVPAVEGFEIRTDLYHELETVAYDILQANFGGWEINEGSAGTMTINVMDRKISIHHGWTVETTEYQDVELT